MHCNTSRVSVCACVQIDTTVLQESLHRAQDVHAVSDSARTMVAWGHLVMRLRNALMCADLALVESVLVEVGRGGMLVTEGHMANIDLAATGRMLRAEFIDVENQVTNVRLISLLRHGLSVGRVTGEVGSVDTTTVDTTALEAAIRIADERGSVSQEVAHLLRLAQFVVKIRVLVVRDAWDFAARELQVCACDDVCWSFCVLRPLFACGAGADVVLSFLVTLRRSRLWWLWSCAAPRSTIGQRLVNDGCSTERRPTLQWTTSCASWHRRPTTASS